MASGTPGAPKRNSGAARAYYMTMHEDSPPPFIVIRTPKRRTPYDRSLELVGVVQKLLDVTKARFHLKDRLDREMTALVFELSNVRHQAKSVRWRHYRAAHKLANDCATILDILAHQEAAPTADLETARKAMHDLLAELHALG
jgi:hypothetical protein